MAERVFYILVSLAIAIQLIIIAFAISLDPVSVQGQKMFAGFIASSFIILSLLLYAYKGWGKPIKPTGKGLEDPNDQEWYAVGAAFIIFIFLMILLV